MSDSDQLLDSYWGLILVNTAFQLSAGLTLGSTKG
jgi:ABC-type glycerol-3-phosphate transport system permease component